MGRERARGVATSGGYFRQTACFFVFSALRDADTETVADGLDRAERSIDTLLNLISSRLGLDHDRVLGGRYAFPVMSRFLQQQGAT